MALKHSPDTQPLGHYRQLTLGSLGLEAPVSRGVAGVSVEGCGVGRPGAASGADLGGSSKYSREITWTPDVEEGSM